MNKFFSNPWVRMAARALIAGLIAGLTQIGVNDDGTIAWRSAVVAGGLAFAEIFTPINAILGAFRQDPTPQK